MSASRGAGTFGEFRDGLQSALQGAVPRHLDRLRWSAARIDRTQRAGLRSLVAHAIAHSPFHRRRLAGLDPRSLTPADLASLPVMTKAEMMDELDDVLTDRSVHTGEIERALDATTTEPVVIARRCIAMASGGSSGRRGVFCFDQDALVAFMGALARPAVARLTALGGPTPGGVTIALVGAPSAVHATGAAPVLSAEAALPLHFAPVPVTLPFDTIVDRLNALQAPLLYGYPSMLARLAEEQRRGRLRLSLLGVTSTSETLLPELRDAIRSGFGAPVVDTFGATEGLVGVSPPDDPVLAFNSDGCIVELVDEQDRPVPDGEPSAKILVTNLTNRLQPLIRYQIEDSFRREPPAAEHGHLRARVEGRSDDVLHFGSVTIHPLVVRTVMVGTPAVADYQVRQTARGIDVDVVGAPVVEADRLRTRLASALHGAGLARADVVVHLVTQLRRDPRTGKHRRFVPLAAEHARAVG